MEITNASYPNASATFEPNELMARVINNNEVLVTLNLVIPGGILQQLLERPNTWKAMGVEIVVTAAKAAQAYQQKALAAQTVAAERQSRNTQAETAAEKAQDNGDPKDPNTVKHAQPAPAVETTDSDEPPTNN